jgi:hypothetical protein
MLDFAKEFLQQSNMAKMLTVFSAVDCILADFLRRQTMGREVIFKNDKIFWHKGK